MYEYSLELFFYMEGSPLRGLQDAPILSHFSKETKMIKIRTWENYKNVILSDYPNVGYILIHDKKTLVPLGEYISQFETSILKIKTSRIHGLGVFPQKDLLEGEKIVSLDGELIEASSYCGKYPKGEWNAISKTHYLVREKRTIYGFINHSLEPNVVLCKKELVLKAKKKIEKNEELIIDYTMEYLSESYLSGHGSTYLYKESTWEKQ